MIIAIFDESRFDGLPEGPPAFDPNVCTTSIIGNEDLYYNAAVPSRGIAPAVPHESTEAGNIQVLDVSRLQIERFEARFEGTLKRGLARGLNVPCPACRLAARPGSPPRGAIRPPRPDGPPAGPENPVTGDAAPEWLEQPCDPQTLRWPINDPAPAATMALRGIPPLSKEAHERMVELMNSKPSRAKLAMFKRADRAYAEARWADRNEDSEDPAN